MVDSGAASTAAGPSNAPAQPAHPAKPSVLLRRGKRSFLIALPSSYADALAEARRLFSKLDSEQICLQREMVGLGWVTLTESGWETNAARMQDCEVDPVILLVEVEAKSDAETEAEEEKPLKRVKQEEDAQPATRPTKRTRAEEPPWTLELSLEDNTEWPAAPPVMLSIRSYGCSEPELRIRARLTTPVKVIYQTIVPAAVFWSTRARTAPRKTR